MKTSIKKTVSILITIILFIVLVPVYYFLAVQNEIMDTSINEVSAVNSTEITNDVNESINQLTDYFSVSEKNYYIANYNAEEFEILYDLNERPILALIISNDGYAIVNRLTATSFERTDFGSHPYIDFMDYKKYYVGFQKCYIKQNGMYFDFNSEIDLTESDIEFNNQFLNNMIMTDISDNGIINYNSRTTNAERENYSYIMNGGEYFVNLNRVNINNYFYKIPEGYDLIFPKNNGSSCGIVALVQLIQFYERYKNIHTIPNNFSITQNFDYVSILPTLDNFWEIVESKNYITTALHNELARLTPIGAFGENYTSSLIKGLNNFYELYYNRSYLEKLYYVRPNYNSGYKNMVASIQDGRPAIGETWTGNGYYKINGTWTKIGVARHQMVVYGYCTTKKGSLQDFICHSGWLSGTSKLYLYKTNFIENFTHTLSLNME